MRTHTRSCIGSPPLELRANMRPADRRIGYIKRLREETRERDAGGELRIELLR